MKVTQLKFEHINNTYIYICNTSKKIQNFDKTQNPC